MSFKFMLFSLLVIFSSLCGATEESTHLFQMPEYEHWTDQKNVLSNAIARPFFGVINASIDSQKEEEVFFLIGGSTFNNDKKGYESTVQCLSLRKTASQSQIIRKNLDLQYPMPIAEGLAIETPQGLLCVGGQNNEGITNKVFLLKTNPLRFEPMPDFPVPTSMSCGGFIDGKAYVYEADRLFAFNFKTHQWETLPGIPGDKSRQQPAGCVQMADQKVTSLFIFGGYDASTPNNRALSDCWQFTPSTGKWSQCADLHFSGNTYSTIGAMALPSGCENILIVGGFDPSIWNETNEKLATLKGDALLEYQRHYFAQPLLDFKWNRSVLNYQTITNSWCLLDNPTPFATTGAAVGIMQNKILIAGGELKPKLRCDDLQIGNFERVREFGTLNWVIFLVYLGLMLPFGFFFMKRGKDTKDYFKGGGRIPWWVNGVSIFATMLSSLTFMTIPAMTFISDWRYFPTALAIFIMAPVVIYLYLPFFRRLNITSAYEYLELRFNVFSRIFASAAFIVFMVARSAVVIFLPSLALSAVAGIDLYASIILVGSITVVYSTIGGMEAVVWSDFVQAIILIGGAIVVAILLINGAGGMTETLTVANEGAKLNMLDFSLNIAEPVLWVTLIGGIAANLASYTSDQTIVQRYLTTVDEKGAARSIWFNGILSIFASGLFYFIGTGLYAFYKKNPGAFDVVMDKPDSILPTFIVTQLPMGVSGLVIASIFAATMSTLSSNFNSAATAFVTDFYRRFISDNEKKAFHVAHVTTAIVGILAILCAIGLASFQNIYSLFDVFQKIIGILTGGLAGLFLVGIFIPRVNGIGAIAGLAASYIVNMVLIYVNEINVIIPMPELLLKLRPHLLLYGAVGLVACIIVAYIVSIFSSKPKENQIMGLTLKNMIKK